MLITNNQHRAEEIAQKLRALPGLAFKCDQLSVLTTLHHSKLRASFDYCEDQAHMWGIPMYTGKRIIFIKEKKNITRSRNATHL